MASTEMKLPRRQAMAPLSIPIVLFVFLQIVEAQTRPFFINCGSNSTLTVGARNWLGDLSPDSNLTLSSQGIESSAPTLTGESPLLLLYTTARIFTQPLNYTFQGISPGNHVLRLHFCPLSSDDRNFNDSSFAVLANGLRLLSEFDAPAEISRRPNSTAFFVLKEFILAVDSGSLVVEFVPDRGSFGFASAIEVVQVVDNFFPETVSKVGGAAVSLGLPVRGAEVTYRLNVGGPEIGPEEDPGQWRTWEVDSSYMVTANAGSEIRNSSAITQNETWVGPAAVYESARSMSNNQLLEKKFNMSWRFGVSPGFDYLVRLHFCELQYDQPKQRTFRIFINNRTAADGFDVFSRAGGMDVAYRHDFLDSVSPETATLWVQLGPGSAGAAVPDAFLNGLEVFKLSRGGSLAYLERRGGRGSALGSSGRPRGFVLWVGIGGGVAALAILASAVGVFCAVRSRRAKRWRPAFLLRGDSAAKGGKSQHGSVAAAAAAGARGGRRFSLAEIRAATNNFDERLVIGVGGFGKVYRGETEDGTQAAVKRANPQSQQGASEFETEIEMLSRLRHRHLVSMMGFCEEQREMILVYEYMANGTLRSHLFGSGLPPLTWKRRVEACIGAARGLHYLHTGAERGIIHRDVKTTNILLDAAFVAKVSDFGLSKDGPALDRTHVSTAVKGSFGYLDPEYFRRQQLTEKSDVYSFGVVLFEVACARPVINPTLPKDQINLAEWAMTWQRQKGLEAIVDPRLQGGFSPESMGRFGEVAEKCLADEGKNRPTMGEVLWHLEYVLQLQEAWLRTNEAPEAKDDLF